LPEQDNKKGHPVTDDRKPTPTDPPLRRGYRNEAGNIGDELTTGEPGDIADDANLNDSAEPRPIPKNERLRAPRG
jgi:hypothetical protein